ncbi:DUF799 domain-containing protein [Parvularcula dongshanensis]|uniref:Lipoprotein n=1 Tax=Parvularcula dongshanensis TaxID=1173995 RepID=A0A840I5J5_9PROT|nr:GNA1162 family protein [Parvularcula dongshanensis]MBB4659428.1 hypothetical protein [Parvularcula dongshanensis]
MMKPLVLALGLLAMTACATAPAPYDYSAFRSEAPRSIVILPALNNTTNVEAHEWFVSTVSRPFGERGYYVYPAWMVKRTLEDSGLGDAALVHEADTRRLSPIFGCDAAMYIDIQQWESKYVLIQTNTTVAFEYELRSCKTGETLWANQQQLTYSPQASSTGNLLGDLVAQAVVSAIEKARPNYIPLAQQANAMAAASPGRGVPAGPYLPDQYGQDENAYPSALATTVE